MTSQSQSCSQSQKQISKNCEIFHGCYLLVSHSDNPRRKGRTYIGYTTDPARRIKQHNGEIKFGGAKKTSMGRPWSMILYVHGFQSEIGGLRFEWAWQHPERSRRLRDCPSLKKKAKESHVTFRVRILQEMLHSAPWKNLGLNIHWLREDFRSHFADDTLVPLPHMKHIAGPYVSKDANHWTKNLPPLELPQDCKICITPIYSKEDAAMCPQEECRAVFHLVCLGDIMNENGANTLIQAELSTPCCYQSCRWVDVISLRREIISL